MVGGEGEDEMAIVIHSPQEGVECHKPMPLSELMKRLEPAARSLLEQDDDEKGA